MVVPWCQDRSQDSDPLRRKRVAAISTHHVPRRLSFSVTPSSTQDGSQNFSTSVKSRGCRWLLSSIDCSTTCIKRLPTCRLSSVPVSASLASGSAIGREKACENCDLSSNRNSVSQSITLSGSAEVESRTTGRCKTLLQQNTLLSCWSMSTCAATEVCLVNNLRRASYPLRKLSSGADGFLMTQTGRQNHLTVTHPLLLWTPLQ